MNPGQEKFQEFILNSVNEENKDEALALLKESFAKQDEGTFNEEYMKTFIPRMLPLIKEDKLEQVKTIMLNHKA